MMIIFESQSLIVNALCVLLCIVVLRWLLNLINFVWFTPKGLEKSLRQQGLVGNSYRFLIGDMKEASQLRSEAMVKPIRFTHDYYHRIQPLLHRLLTKSGSNCFSWMGPVPTILVTQPEQIKDGFNRMNEFRKPKLNPLIQTFSPGLVHYEGHQWAKHRKILTPAFHLDKLKPMLPAFETSIIETINNWEKIVFKTGSSEIDVWPHFTKLTANAISRAAFGRSFEDGKRIFELLTKQKELIIRLIKYAYIPGWKYLPTKGNKRMDEMNAEIKILLKTVINTRKKTMEAGEPAKDDLLGILLDSNSKEAKQLSESESESSSKKRLDLAMSFEEVIDECKLFFLAGQETTSVLLAWTIALLGKHQEWQTRAREEVLATFGMNHPDYDGLNSRLKIVTMILYEVLRLYPSIVATSRKVYGCETRLGDLVIPPGVAVSFSILHAHLDPEVWGKDVKEFKPERFSEGISKATKGINSYFPFGWGPRICIGQSFALIEAKMALSMILQCFSFEISPSYTHAPTTFIALQPQHGVPIILHKL
ncbi:cytochrome P450 CYP72A219-like [Chenopodium quinoa]|uniref:cytochrome P450 CYP72A219-like n=1 Tax=Chenopodium quinoa TaxID=63459 RepID=UPI000B799172|nr:cytochrome P450 CYP72A219-like [Chenopodium quinoa]